MATNQLVSDVLHDEALTRGLADPEARMLVEWLVDHIERIGASQFEDDDAHARARRLYRRGRAISRFVRLWCHGGAAGAALQLAGSERFTWPLPSTSVDPCELMESILDWENQGQAAAE
jgi:hypothetical protein